MTEPKRLVVIGDLVLDILVAARLPLHAAQHQTARQLHFEAGGACTTVFAARALGLSVAVLGALGVDIPGDFLQRILQAAAVDTSALQRLPGSSTTTVLALQGGAAGHVFVGQYGEGPALPFCARADTLLTAADALFLPGYSLLEQRMNALTQTLLARKPELDARLYVDVGPFLGELAPQRLPGLLQAADVLLLTAEEVPFVCGGRAGLAALHELLARYPQLCIVLKLGAQGCRVLTGAQELHCPGFAVPLVDSIGAGDAFAAAYIWAELQGYSIGECASIANAMGAASVSKLGAGRNVPSKNELEQLMGKKLC